MERDDIMAIIKEKNAKKWTKDGRSWYFDVYYTDMYGNRKEKKSKYYKSKKIAAQEEQIFLTTINKNDIVDNNVSFEFVFNEWLEYKRPTIKASTFYGIKKKTSKHILQYFKDFKLHYIKINIINNWMENMKQQEMKVSSINTIITYLKEILLYAKDNYDFDIKVVSKIHKIKLERTITKNDAEWNFWTYDQFKEFISNVDNNFYYVIFNFLYYTGLRPGEFIALTWNDISLKDNKLHITKTFTNKIEDRKYAITDPKTKNSIRTIDLDDDLNKMMIKFYNSESKLYKFNSDMFIFGNIKYVPPTTLARNLDKYINKTRENNPTFKRITPHGFRHSHVSLLINLGADSRDVAERIGDTVRLVEETYYHMFPNKKSHTVNIINKFKNENIEKTR